MEHCSSEKNKTTITHINTDASSEHNAEWKKQVSKDYIQKYSTFIKVKLKI